MFGSGIASVFTGLTQLPENFFAVDGLDAVGLDAFIATVKRVANLRQFS